MHSLLLTSFMLLVLSLCSSLLTSPAVAMEKVAFFYFNPDSVQSNFSLLTKEIDTFMTKQGYLVKFQAFSQQSDFDLLLSSRRPSFVLVPAWYYEQYGKNMGLTPLLISLNQSKPSYTKVLLKRSGEVNTTTLSNKTLAVTSMGTDTEKQLALFFNNGRSFDFAASHLIITPKDADALYALALGQVDMAVVGKNTLDVVRAVNRRIVDVVAEVASSHPVPMPILCVLDGEMSREEISHLKQIFFSAGDGNPLPEFMKMLQFNGWQNAKL